MRRVKPMEIVYLCESKFIDSQYNRSFTVIYGAQQRFFFVIPRKRLNNFLKMF